MYLPYEPLSKKGDESTYVPEELSIAQKKAIKTIPKKITNIWDDWVCEQLQLTKEELFSFFSSEQIDSIGICIYNFQNKSNFIIGDETGIGKGRILSGISRWAILNNLKVLFFTEREHLLTEFWKDLSQTKNLDILKEPICFHSSSKMFNLDGSIALKGTATKMKNLEKSGIPEETNIIFTNYSQISLKNHHKEKIKLLSNYLDKGAIIILDESHNATGDSNTKIAMLELIEKSKHTVFSSATYIKDESQFELYQKSIKMNKNTLKLLQKTLSQDKSGILRKVFTYEFTKNLLFWRREHEPLNVGWNIVECENIEQQNAFINNYSLIINGLFNIVNNFQNNSVEMEIAKSAWFSMGATINRMSRNLLLLLKIETLVESVVKSHKNNHKGVIVLDSTLASLVQKILKNDEESNTEEDNLYLDLDETKITKELNFENALHFVIDSVLGDMLKYGEVFLQAQKLKEKASIFKDLTLSPIDTIITKLAENGITCEEISGRSFGIDSKGKIYKLEKRPKTMIVKDFNSGKTDVLVITRAGASGISLHASADFLDQRVRDFYELEITNRPTYRLQFIGRVNRKNQVVKPEFFSVITKLPFEQRILSVEQQKLQKLNEHTNGEREKLNQQNVYNFYNDTTEKSAKTFLIHNPKLAEQMGISLKKESDEYYFVDSLLKRCIVLTAEQQNFLYDFLIFSVQAHEKINIKNNLPSKIVINSIKTFWHQLDKSEQEKFQKLYRDFPQNSLNQFVFPWVGVMNALTTHETKPLFSLNIKKEFEENLLTESVDLEHITKLMISLSHRKDYNQEHLRNHLFPILNQLKLGSGIGIDTNQGMIWGYVHEIIYPKIPQSYKYENLTLIHLKCINPHIHSSLHYAQEDYYFNIHDLIYSDKIKISHKPINWNQFDRTSKPLERNLRYLIGQPIYMQFLQQIYEIGEVQYLDIDNSKKMLILLPNNISDNILFNLPKPIWDTTEIMSALISRQLTKLYTNWQSMDEVKTSLILEHTFGGYNLMVAIEIAKNYDFMDIPLRKKLKDYRGNNNGYYWYFITYKEIRQVLYNLEQKGIIWFNNQISKFDKKD